MGSIWYETNGEIMMDRFMEMVGLSQQYKKTRNPITKWKMLHRKHEILKELRSKNQYSVDDMLQFSFMLQYAFKKWPDDPEINMNRELNFLSGVDNHIIDYRFNSIKLVIDVNKSDGTMDIEESYIRGISHKYTKKTIDWPEPIYVTTNLLIEYQIKAITNKLLEGEKSD
jgi:hypothetical protein